MNNLKNNPKIPFIATILLSIIIPILLISPVGFPFTGIALSIILLTSSILYFRSKITVWNVVIYILSLFFSLFLIVRANPLLIFFDILANISLICVLFLPDNYLKHVWNLILMPFEAFGKALTTDNQFPLSLKGLQGNFEKRPSVTASFIVSILITVVVLGITVPLLSASNPIFANFIDSVLKFFDISEFIKSFFSENAIIWLIRGVFFLILIYLIPKGISYVKEHTPWESHKNLLPENLSLTLPKIAVSIIFLIFFITQAELYFASSQTLQSLNLSNSEATREVFAHLLVVCLVAFGLIYNDRSEKKLNRWTTYILLGGVFLMNLVAFKSDLDYTNLYGFTEKRLYGFAVNFWILGAIGIYLFDFLKRNHDKLVKKLYIWLLVVLGLVNILNFDYLIYNVNPARLGKDVDTAYLSTLSEDSGGYKDIYEKVLAEHNKANTYTIYPLANKINLLRDSVEKAPFQSFNLSRYLAYQQIKDLSTETLPISPTPTPTPASFQNSTKPITITLKNIEPRFMDKRFELLKWNVNENSRQDGRLNGASFVHTLGAGEFSLHIHLDGQQIGNGFSPSREIHYIIPDGFDQNSLDLDFSQF